MDVTSIVEELEDLLEQKKLTTISALIADLSLSDLQAVLERLSKKDRTIVFRLLAKDKSIQVFERLDASIESEIFTELRTEEVNQIFIEMDPDDRVSLLDELPASIASRLVKQLDPKELALTATILGYQPGSIGRRMSPEFIHTFEKSTVEETIKAVRKKGAEAESIYAIPVVNTTRTLVGVVSLRDILTAKDNTKISEISSTPEYAYATDDEEQAAHKCVEGKYLVLPIVDKEQKLVGILTIGEAQSILAAAADEDAARAGATEPLRRPYLSTPIFEVMKSRVVWLLVLAVSGLFTVKAINFYQGLLQAMVVLASFIPLLTGIGGNTGSQAATTVTRALALNDITLRDFTKIVAKESRIGLSLGITLGAIALIPAYFIYDYKIALVICLTTISICTMAATVGGAMPLIGKKLKADPAVFSTPFISTFCDATGLIIYFSIAKLVLGL